MLELPYEGGESSFLIVLPNQIDGIELLENQLEDPTLLNEAVDKMYQAEVDIYLPKFKIETTIDLKDVLTKVSSIPQNIC